MLNWQAYIIKKKFHEAATIYKHLLKIWLPALQRDERDGGEKCVKIILIIL